MLTQRPISYTENLFPNVINPAVPPQKLDVGGNLYSALRSEAFNDQAFYMDMSDIKEPPSRVSIIEIENEEAFKSIAKSKLVEKENETAEMLHQMLYNKKKENGDRKRAAFEMKVRDHLLQQGVSNGMSEDEVKQLIDRSLANEAVDRASNDNVSVYSGGSALERSNILGEQDDLSSISTSPSWASAMREPGGQAAIPTNVAANLSTVQAGAIGRINNAQDYALQTQGLSFASSGSALSAGERTRNNSDRLNALSYGAAGGSEVAPNLQVGGSAFASLSKSQGSHSSRGSKKGRPSLGVPLPRNSIGGGGGTPDPKRPSFGRRYSQDLDRPGSRAREVLGLNPIPGGGSGLIRSNLSNYQQSGNK